MQTDLNQWVADKLSGDWLAEDFKARHPSAADHEPW